MSVECHFKGRKEVIVVKCYNGRHSEPSSGMHIC